MGERRNHVGGALLGVAGLCWVSTVIADGANALGWGSLASILLLAAGGMCLIGALWAFGFSYPLPRLRQRLGRVRSVHEREKARAALPKPERCHDLLLAQLKKGRAARAWAVHPAPASLEESRQGQLKKREKARRWGEETAAMLREHFPLGCEGFCPHWERCGQDGRLAVETEIMELGGADSYLREKFQFLETLLRDNNP